MGANEQVDPAVWARVSSKKAGRPEIVIKDPMCARIADQEYTRSRSEPIAVYYRINLYLLTGASVSTGVDAEELEPSPLAASKCSCKWSPPAGPLMVHNACLLHSHLVAQGW